MLKPPQPWARAAACAAVVGGLLPVAWRLHMLGWGAGWSQAPLFREGGALAYVLGLVTVEAGATLLTLGLVQRWGEVWPAWVPGLGGRRIPPRFVLIVAITGATILTAIVAVTAWQLVDATRRGISNPVTQVEAGWLRAFMLAHYVPSVLWPLGLWVAIAGFALRHRDDEGVATRSVATRPGAGRLSA